MTEKRIHKWLVPALALLLVGGCGMGRQLSKTDQDRAANIEATLAEARGRGAATCAPRELARAEAWLDHARHEAAEYAHKEAADDWQKAATAAVDLLSKVKACEDALAKASRGKDADGDGVPDYIDRCPGTKKGVAVNATGCPLDTDGDGVADYQDKCPNTPRGATVDASGCLPDTDGDQLADWDESTRFKTDPRNPDTDADGLWDGVEVLQHGTLPTNPDTDGDGLKDGEEVDRYHTDPRLADTDGGSVNDGLEVGVAGTDPLDPSDDVKELKCVQMAVHFDHDSAVVKPEYDKEVARVAQYLKDYPELEVVIEGHTDAVGTVAYNLDLSVRRANAVVSKLVKDHGIDGSRLRAEGFGSSRPIASNDTDEGRAKNRRIYAILGCE